MLQTLPRAIKRVIKRAVPAPRLLCDVGLVADAVLQHLHDGWQVGGRDDGWALLAAMHKLKDPPCASTHTAFEPLISRATIKRYGDWATPGCFS